jgi:tetratricopeptide (TPR) repeat protein
MPRLYQQLLTGVASYEALGKRIIKRIELAHAFRQTEQVRELARILINIPIKEYQLIAQYYLVWCKCREYEYPAATLESIIEQTQTYKTKALFSRGAIEWYKGKNETALYFYKEALRTSPTISEHIDLSRTIAVLKATEGFHKSAMRDLENLEPLIRYAEPRLYYDFLNSYAIELAEAGRKQEARNISRIVLASPFAPAYPEWQDTAEDLKPANRSFVAKSRSRYKRQNVLPMPEVEHGETEQISYNAPAIVFSLQHWKDKMAKRKKKKDDNGEKTPETLTERDIIFRIISMYTSPETTPAQRYKIWDSVQRIIATPDDPMPDDDSDGA